MTTAGDYEARGPCPAGMTDIFAFISVMKVCHGPGTYGDVFVPGGATQDVTAWRTRVFRVPAGTTRDEIFGRIYDRVPEFIRTGGTVTAFTAGRNDFGGAP